MAISRRLPALSRLAGPPSLAVFLSFTALSLFFMLKDMLTIGAFVERHLLPRRLRSGCRRYAPTKRGPPLGDACPAIITVSPALWLRR